MSEPIEEANIQETLAAEAATAEAAQPEVEAEAVEPEPKKRAPRSHKAADTEAVVAPAVKNSVLVPVSGEDVDKVFLSRFVFGKRQKSLSVHQAQARLAELGYGEATADIDGQFGELTRRALVQYQTDNGIESPDGSMTWETLEKLFAGVDVIEIQR